MRETVKDRDAGDGEGQGCLVCSVQLYCSVQQVGHDDGINNNKQQLEFFRETEPKFTKPKRA